MLTAVVWAGILFVVGCAIAFVWGLVGSDGSRPDGV